MATNVQLVKNAARTRQAARKAGVRIEESEKPEYANRLEQEQEQPDIM